MPIAKNTTELICAHCSADTGKSPVWHENQIFCCEGCKTVYDILHKNNLCDFYQIDTEAAVSLKNKAQSKWSIEELNLMATDFTQYENGDLRTVLFHIPSMHCSSCIWLLEKLPDLNTGVTQSRSDFLKKQLKITYNQGVTSFGEIVIILRSLGYEPNLMPEDSQQSNYVENRSILIKLGVAGFCAGNIMMFSFPQYLGLDVAKDVAFGKMFNALNIVLSLPLIFYCAADYFKAFFQWIKYKTISVKVPLALGIGALWLRSIYEVSTFNGAGYFDSLAGLIFFLIIGTWLQNRAFDAMRFGEKARKFFPLVSRTVVNNKLVPKKVVDLVVGDRVRVVYGEIIPADGILMGSEATVEYSYATGESAPQYKVAGEVLLGGGKNLSAQFEMEVIRPFDQSRLNEIWNSGEKEAADGKRTPDFEAVISKYFIFTTVFIALAALGFWWFKDPSKAWFAFTAVLMVACPCALALAPPFAYNIVANFFASKGLFLRKPGVTGQMGQVTGVVFDKTGTLTLIEKIQAKIPKEFSEKEIRLLVSIAAQSKHPYSMAISAALEGYELLPIENFEEIPGKGTTGICGGNILMLGSMEFVSGNRINAFVQNKELWFSVNSRLLLPIAMHDVYRNRLDFTFKELKEQGKKITVASGDTWAEGEKMQRAFPGLFDQVFFECKPAQKAMIIEDYQKAGHVLMVGDGLNDAGALKTGDVGMVVSENTNNFTPEASAILLQESFNKLPDFLRIAKKANRVVKETFIVSLTYNAIAITLAFTGQMSPLIAAILMPASSVALMLYAWARTKIMVRKEHGI